MAFCCGKRAPATSYREATFMAELQTATLSKSGKPTQKRFSTRVDLTPMVDLGFLLLTFFIFTTTLLQPSVIKLTLPENGLPTEVSEEKTLNLVLYKNNAIGYYMGADVNTMRFTNYSPSGIRAVIQDIAYKIAQRFNDKSQLYTVIKPSSESSYKNVIDVLDEMLINDVKRYVLTGADEKEIKQETKKNIRPYPKQMLRNDILAFYLYLLL